MGSAELESVVTSPWMEEGTVNAHCGGEQSSAFGVCDRLDGNIRTSSPPKPHLKDESLKSLR